MKYKNLTLTLTAAVLTLVTAVAYGQSNPLIATIPFGFRAVKSNLLAGRYTIARAAGSMANSGIMQLRNIETGKSVFPPIRGHALGVRGQAPPAGFSMRRRERMRAANAVVGRRHRHGIRHSGATGGGEGSQRNRLSLRL
jgi:hypothetical protein